MRWLLTALLLGAFSGGLHAADEPHFSGDKPADAPQDATKDVPKDKPVAGDAKKAPPKDAPPKKTEYDKLPLPQLLAKANANDLTAQFELASRFNYGRGMPKNTGEALRWLRRAALAGQEDAARLLAVKLYNGHDVIPDFSEAMKWARVLAEKGDVPGQMMLANMYANGEGTQRDLVQAYMWYAVAAVGAKREGSKEAPQPEQIQAAVDARDKITGLLTEEQEAEAQKMASDWWMGKYVPPTKIKAKARSRQKQHSAGKPRTP